MLNESRIVYFLSLTETLNFSETAVRFGVSQQAISKSIAALEQDLGVALFTRSRSFVRLTEAGKEWRNFFQEWYSRFQESRERITEHYAARQARLRLGYQNYIVMGDLTGSLLTGIGEAAPGADIRVECYSPVELLDHLMNNQLDVILVCRRFIPKMKGFSALSLFQMPLLILVSAMHPKVKEGCTYRDFINEPFVVDRMERESREDCIKRAQRECARYGLTPGRIITVANRDSAYTTVELGQGILLGTASSRFRNSRQLKSYYANATDTLICMWREGESNPLVNAYVKALKEYCKAEEEI